MTEIELRLVSKITEIFMRELTTAWENVTKLDLIVDRVESNPHLVQVVPPNEVVLLISLEITLGDVRGMINLCIPFNSIERVSTQLAANTWVSQQQNAPTEASQQIIAQHLDKSRVEIVVTLAESTITTADLVGLRVGDIITTDKDIQTLLEVAIEGVSRFEASPGALKGQKAIQVEGIIAPPQRTAAAEPKADAS
jgi:flagellar motor switch protein FliM